MEPYWSAARQLALSAFLGPTLYLHPFIILYPLQPTPLVHAPRIASATPSIWTLPRTRYLRSPPTPLLLHPIRQPAYIPNLATTRHPRAPQHAKDTGGVEGARHPGGARDPERVQSAEPARSLYRSQNTHPLPKMDRLERRYSVAVRAIASKTVGRPYYTAFPMQQYLRRPKDQTLNPQTPLAPVPSILLLVIRVLVPVYRHPATCCSQVL